MRISFALATMMAFIAMSTVTRPAKAQTQVEAGGQQCIAWRFVPMVSGIYDSSYIEYTNTCSRAVSFFLCESQVFVQTYPSACNANTGIYSFMNAPVGWRSRSSVGVRGEKVVVIRECPADTKSYAKTGGRFYCKR